MSPVRLRSTTAGGFADPTGGQRDARPERGMASANSGQLHRNNNIHSAGSLISCAGHASPFT
jgi:hypothetical protein